MRYLFESSESKSGSRDAAMMLAATFFDFGDGRATATSKTMTTCDLLAPFACYRQQRKLCKNLCLVSKIREKTWANQRLN